MINFIKRVVHHKKAGFSLPQSVRISIEISMAMRQAMREINKHRRDELIKATVL